MKEIFFWGATGQALVLNDFIAYSGYKLVAFFDRDKNLKSPVEGVPLFHSDDFESWFARQESNLHFAIAIGGSNGNEKIKLHDMLIKKGASPCILIHPAAFVSQQAILGEGCQVMAHATVITGAKLGRECIVNTNASVDHECILGDGVHIAPAVTLAGCVEVGDHSFIGTGAVVLPRLKIGKNVIVGAGAVVTRDIPDGKVAYGNPARIIR